MIPKTIHYCWFGRGRMPQTAERCIQSWQRQLPDYEIVRWDEDSFDVSSNKYVKQAYEAKKYAFVSDYVRLYAIYTQGGIYMDTDVEVLRGLDAFLENEAFSGFENVFAVPTGIMAGEKGLSVYADLLAWYDRNDFILPDGSMNLTTNVSTITDYFVQHGLEQNNTMQVIDGFAFYPNIVFCPYKHEIGSKYFKKDTYTIHHKDGSWMTDELRKIGKTGIKARASLRIKKVLLALIGKRSLDWLLLQSYKRRNAKKHALQTTC